MPGSDADDGQPASADLAAAVTDRVADADPHAVHIAERLPDDVADRVADGEPDR